MGFSLGLHQFLTFVGYHCSLYLLCSIIGHILNLLGLPPPSIFNNGVQSWITAIFKFVGHHCSLYLLCSVIGHTLNLLGIPALCTYCAQSLDISLTCWASLLPLYLIMGFSLGSQQFLSLLGITALCTYCAQSVDLLGLPPPTTYWVQLLDCLKVPIHNLLGIYPLHKRASLENSFLGL